MPEELRLKIADIVFSILPAGAIKGFSVEIAYTSFMTGESVIPAEAGIQRIRKLDSRLHGNDKLGGFSGQKPDFVLTVKRQSLPHVRYNGCRFNASTWDYCQADGRNIFNFSYSSKNNRPERRLVLDNDFKTGEIILPEGTKPQKGVLRNPFAYPLDQLLMISLLPQMQGFLIHSCGFIYKDKGYLFVGSSGAGKSTMARILGKNKGVHILNDDRIIARKKDDCFYIYGTPWHGTEEIVSPEKAVLGGLFFLKKDKENNLKRLSLLDATSGLLKCSFPPLWDKDGVASTLKICEDIASSTPCFEFSFTPDDRAFEMIREKGLI